MDLGVHLFRVCRVLPSTVALMMAGGRAAAGLHRGPCHTKNSGRTDDTGPLPPPPTPPIWISQVVSRLGAALTVSHKSGPFNYRILEIHMECQNSRILWSTLVCDPMMKFIKNSRALFEN